MTITLATCMFQLHHHYCTRAAAQDWVDVFPPCISLRGNTISAHQNGTQGQPDNKRHSQVTAGSYTRTPNPYPASYTNEP